jgi:16S rRNA C967 or C1407 C5-methylase (RsmB/RsmF family)
LDALWGDTVNGTEPGASTRTFLPSVEGTDGFFVAALTRRA